VSSWTTSPPNFLRSRLFSPLCFRVPFAPFMAPFFFAHCPLSLFSGFLRPPLASFLSSFPRFTFFFSPRFLGPCGCPPRNLFLFSPVSSSASFHMVYSMGANFIICLIWDTPFFFFITVWLSMFRLCFSFSFLSH